MLVSVLMLIYFSFVFQECICSCKVTFITTCSTLADVLSYGNAIYDTTDIIIVNDLGDQTPSPNQVLTNQTFEKAVNLEVMYIVKTLKEIHPNSLSRLQSLTCLKLYKNNLPVLQSGVFKGLINLNNLNLRDNSIETLEPGMFDGKSLISTINLRYNKLTYIQAGTLNLPSLKTIRLSNNFLGYFAPGSFPKSLEKLYLNSNRILTLDVSVLNPLSNLLRLEMASNKISIVINGLSLAKLRVLGLAGNKIRRIEDRAFTNIPNLEALYLTSNKIKSVQLTSFANPNRMRRLYINCNRLVSLAPEFTLILSNLTAIAISGNPWSCQCLEEMKGHIKENHVWQSNSDTEFLENGQSAVCISMGPTCYGNETLTENDETNFQSALIFKAC